MRIYVELVHTAAYIRKVATKLCFHKIFVIFNTDLDAAQLWHTFKLNKPVYVGFTILDLSNMLMYDFHYRHVQELCDKRRDYALKTQTRCFITRWFRNRNI